MRTLFPIAALLLVLLALPGAAVFTADLLGYEVEANRFLEDRFGLSHQLAIGLPAALVLVAVPPLIILLYFLRLKRKPIPVSSTFLWKKSVEDLHVNRLLQWLRRNVLLLLQLAAVFALIYAVLGPRLHGRIAGGNNYIIVIDNSASMSATDQRPSRLEWAKREAIREIDAAADSDSGMVIAFNSTAEILQSFTSNKEELRAAVRRIEPTNRPTRIDEALALAASLANPLQSTDNLSVIPANVEPGKERTYVATEGVPADVHLYSDGRFPTPEFSLSNLGLTLHTPPVETDHEHCNNVGIVGLTAERGWQPPPPDDADANPPRITDAESADPSLLTLTAAIRNYRAEPAGPLTVRLEVLDGDGRLQKGYARKVSLEPMREQSPQGRAVTFYLSEMPEGADRVLKISLDHDGDDFTLDDDAWLAFGVIRKANVLIVTPDNNFLLRGFFDSRAIKALCSSTWLTPDLLSRADYLTPAREGRFDLVVFDRCAPASEDAMPAANTLFIGQPPPPYALPGESASPKAAIVRGPTVQGWDDRHPVMANLRGLYDIGIDESFVLPELPEGSRRLMEAERGHALLLAIPRGTFTDIVMSFALISKDGRWNTRWPLENSFVLFMRNVVLTLGNVRDAGAEESILPGQEKMLRPGAATTLRVTRPDGSARSFDRGTRPDFAYINTDEPGIYTAEWDGQTRRFAINLFPTATHDEGDLAPVKEVTIGAQAIAAGEPRRQPRDLWKYILLAGLFVVLAEWWIYNKRVRI